MSTDATPAAPFAEEPTGPARPRYVDYAVYLIVVRCVLAIGYAFALYTERSSIVSDWRTDGKHVGWSENQLQHGFDSAIRASIIQAVVVALLLLLIAKFIRDGKNWARWLFAVLMILPISPVADIWRLFLAFLSGGLLVRVLSALIGLAALGAVVLLFMPESARFFKAGRASARTGMSLRALLSPRGSQPPAAGGTGAASTGGAAAVNAPQPVTKRGPRAKSRKASAE
jgi:hypothetical protein